ncbi:MAG: transporter, ATP-binding/permease protein [Firmicutes bacterium]|nr:transporter, ATP-binding/permease protein [Bacillota bacterium]
MLKLLKFLKKSVFALVFVTMLLILQAVCDLSLPTYTSDIINVGITNSGIEDTVPEVLRASQMDRLFLFMEDTDTALVKDHYSLLSKDTLSEKEWSDYLDEYPLLSSENLYVWDKEAETELTDALSIPMMMVLSFEGDNETSQQMKEQFLANFPANMTQGNPDIFLLIGKLPPEAKTSMLSGITEKLKEMPEMLLTASASSFIKTEYEAVGIDVGQMQLNYIFSIGLRMIGLALAAMLASIFVTFLSSRIAAGMGKDLRSSVFKKVLSFSNQEMDQFSTASLITRSTNDIQQVQTLIVFLIRIVIYSPILALGGIFKVMRTNNSMTWVLVVGVGAIFILIGTLLIVAMPKFKMMQKLVDRINLVTREIITGLPVIRAFSTVAYEEKRFDKANVDLTKNSLFVNRVMTFMMPVLMMIMNLVSILIIWVGADKINAGTMQVGDMIAFIQYTMQIIMAFLMLTMVSIMLPRATVAAKRIDEILSTKISIKEADTDEPTKSGMKGVLEFRDVSFRYPNAQEDVLSGISFTAKPGETTAIIGSTGSGKSTLINLIPRFYDATEGHILVDGTDITKMKQHSLRDKLGFIPQKGVLFTGTIASNIAFGAPNADEAEIKRAADIAQATEFIDAKPEGYESSISEGGTNVSGGQKQRLSIARAIAKRPEIYVFDDSFSALDFKTDATLRRTLKEQLTDSTLIIVAQRISTIMNAEQIIVLDDGRIAGKGTHKELLKNCEVYQQIASSQLSEEELSYE